MCESKFFRDVTFLIDGSLRSRSHWSAHRSLSSMYVVATRRMLSAPSDRRSFQTQS